MKINYSPLSIITVTICLTAFVSFLIAQLRIIKTLGAGEIFIIIAAFFFTLALLSWVEIFFIPFLTGKPALVLNLDGLFVTSIGQSIQWNEIQKIQIRQNISNHTIKIFLKNPESISIQTDSISRRFWCYLSELADGTPFTFSTIFIKGRANDIYYALKSRLK